MPQPDIRSTDTRDPRPRDHLEYAGRRFHYLWLRDNCPCGVCRHASGQRLHETWQLDPDIAPRSVTAGEQALQVVWPDGHESSYPADFLARHAYDKPLATAPGPLLWNRELALESVSFRHAEVLASTATRRAWLQAVRDYGFAFLSGVPTVPGTIFEVIANFGFVRETNYGRLFEVVSEAEPVNLAYTPNPLSLHTDNPYRDPVPTLQLLHCLKAASEGGVTALADGFQAAATLRARDPVAFELLATQPVEFRFQSAGTDLRHRSPMIQLDAAGEVVGLRVNNRSAAPFNMAFDRMPAFYRAYQRLMSILQEGDCRITFTLQPGDLVLFDNQRVLHGREVAARGERHLQGSYADRDNLLSVVRVLERASGDA